ncbi:MAG: recombinase family protein [Burkholderiaceae bacterium]|nr:MAG: recombinase family protein [Burkholderiaceae bacterium]
MLVGYARVSTVEQETALQLDALHRAGVRKIFSEKAGGVSARPQLQRLLSSLRSGDLLVVYKLDRLARSLADLLAIIERLSNASCGFRSLTEPIDTGTPAGMLMLQLLGAVAQFERSLIVERSIAGQRAAIARGSRPGRPRVFSAATEADVVRLYASGFYTLDSLAFVFDAHPSSVKRAVYRVSKPGHSSLK